MLKLLEVTIPLAQVEDFHAKGSDVEKGMARLKRKNLDIWTSSMVISGAHGDEPGVL